MDEPTPEPLEPSPAMTPFRVRSTAYFGPLNLLVELVGREELSILDLALSDIAVSFLSEIRLSPMLDLEEAGEFLIMLSILLEIKSRALLPTDPKRKIHAQEASNQSTSGSETSVRRQWQKQSAEIQRFQAAATFLANRHRERRMALRRLVDDLGESDSGDGTTTLRELEVWDLTAILSRLLRHEAGLASEKIARDSTPIDVYQDRLEELIRSSGRIALTSLFEPTDTKAKRIGKFLALLELIKQQRVWVEWDGRLNDLVASPPLSESARVGPLVAAEPVATPVSDRHLDGPARMDPPAEVDTFPELPTVPELPRRRSAWSGYRPIRRPDLPGAAGAR